jgi:hypothetical protein
VAYFAKFAKVFSVEHDQMIRALVPDRADQALSISILQSSGTTSAVPDPHRSHASLERNAKCSVIVANEIFRCAVPGSFGDLACQPLGRQLQVTANHNKRRRSWLRTRNANSC